MEEGLEGGKVTTSTSDLQEELEGTADAYAGCAQEDDAGHDAGHYHTEGGDCGLLAV